jgi:hypothetical protein
MNSSVPSSVSVERAGQLLAEGKHAQAEAEARAVLARSPDNIEARVLLNASLQFAHASPRPFQWPSRSSRALRRNPHTG